MTCALIDAAVTKVIEYRADSALGPRPPATNKPYTVPVVEENATFDPITQVRVEPPQVIIEANRVRWVYTLRAKNTAEIDQMRESKIGGVHNEATRRLQPISGASMSQQIMALTRLMQLIYKYTDRTAWSTADKNIVQQCVARLQSVEPNRDVEDNKVGELQALTDPAAINSYDTTTGWPTA